MDGTMMPMMSNISLPEDISLPTYTQVEVCYKLPPKVNSEGFMAYTRDPQLHLLNFSLPKLQLHIVMIFTLTHASHFVLKRLGFPIFISQIIAGIVLGPIVLGKRYGNLFTKDSIEVLGATGALGYALFLFQTGVKMDPKMITRVGRKALCIGIASVLVPLLLSIATLKLLSKTQGVEFASFFLTAINFSTTSFPVITSFLNELKIVNSELGRLSQSCAIVGDLLSLIVVILSTFARLAVQFSVRFAMFQVGATFLFLAIVLLVIRPIMKRVAKRTPEGRPPGELPLSLVILAFLTSVGLSKFLDQFILLGPYILGLAVPDGPPFGSFLGDKFDTMVSGIFLPLFVTTCAMRLQTLKVSLNTDLMRTDLIIIIVAISMKFVSCLLPLLYSKMPKRDAFSLALVMSSKGFVELATYTFLNDRKIVNENMFAIMAIAIISVSSIVPVLVRILYDPSRKYAGYQKRNILNSRPNSELPIVACIHVPNNVSSVINLLEVSCPSRDSPIAVSVLHLVKLSGQAAPQFISYQNRNKTLSNISYSENVILSFDKFEGNNWGVVSVQAFTAISPMNLMHEDICTLALDQLASLIILPFHRRWYIDGSIESDDQAIRTLNSKVLERAPCSIGILMDRGNLRLPPSSYSSAEASQYEIAMIFMGGKDDQEALTFAKRMARDTANHLTVVHLVVPSEDKRSNWDQMLDAEVLVNVRNNKYIRYIEKETKDGPETAFIVRSMVNDFDLIIVGRRYNLDTPHTAGLKEWSEMPELGVIGDLLASQDCEGKCSVLVVQQQQTT